MDVCNLLIIDDDPTIRNLLNQLLAGRQDINLLMAGSGPEAVSLFASNRVDVLLTEINMPGIAGLELVADMKKINLKPEILVMTSNATPENVETSRQLGARSVMLKPFDDLQVIEAEINKAVAAARAARSTRAGGNAPVAASTVAAHPPVAPPAAPKPAAIKPAIANPAAAVAPAHPVPVSEPLPDFDAWNGDLSGNDTPVAAPPPVSARPAPAPIAVAPAPAASLRPVNGHGLRAASKPAPAVAAVPPAPAAAPEPAPDPPAPAQVQRSAAAPPSPAPRPAAPPVPAPSPVTPPVPGPRPVAPPAAAPRPAASPAPVSRTVAPPVPAPVQPVAAPAVVPRVASAASAPAARAAAPAHQPAPLTPTAVKSPAPRFSAAAPRPAAHAAPAAAVAPAIAPPPEDAIPEIPVALEGIFRTAGRFDTGKLRMQVPIICLQTWEEKGAIAALRILAASLQREFCVWSVGKGLVKENGQSMGDIYREPGRSLEFIRRHKSNGLYLFADFRPWLEDKAVVRLLREMVMELETARSMLVLTAPRLPVPPELQPVCAAFDWPEGGSADPLALYEEVAEEVAAATGLGLDLPAAERDALVQLIKDMPAGRARFEIARALMARAR